MSQPKIVCLQRTYYLLNDPTPEVVPNLRRDNGEACATSAVPLRRIKKQAVLRRLALAH